MKQKLELTWIGKQSRSKLEPRILLEDSEKSYHAKHRITDNDICDNRLIFGDNLLTLKALEAEFSGKVKCAFIDPPYNTGSAFTNYDDGVSIRSGCRDKSNMSKYIFGGFTQCLYPVQKFASDAERILAVILDRDAMKWFKPAKEQFQIFYKQGADHLEYQPDFVAETNDTIFRLEPKASNQMTDPIVMAKMEAVSQWCKNASDYALANGSKLWRYILIPHNAIAQNMTLEGLV